MSDQDDWENSPHARALHAGLPGALAKATGDYFIYKARLRSGEIVQFSQAALSENGEWVHLTEPKVEPLGRAVDAGGTWGAETDGTFSRGMDVRLADIIWVADCGN